MPNQSSSFAKRRGIEIVREVDGSPSLTDITILEVSDGTLTNPGTGVARIDTSGSGATAADIREVILVFAETVAAGTAINIQTGVYGGGTMSPAVIDGVTNVTLPATGAAFEADGRIVVNLNGQELNKDSGASPGDCLAQWVSATQIKLGIKIKAQGQLLVRAPFPTA